MSQWEEVPNDNEAFGVPSWSAAPNDDSNPFGGIEKVDGLVYSDDHVSPELQWEPSSSTAAPELPTRERPTPMAPRRVDPWKPGPDPVPVQHKEFPPALKMVAVLAVPLMILAGLAMVVIRVMNAYGL